MESAWFPPECWASTLVRQMVSGPMIKKVCKIVQKTTDWEEVKHAFLKSQLSEYVEFNHQHELFAIEKSTSEMVKEFVKCFEALIDEIGIDMEAGTDDLDLHFLHGLKVAKNSCNIAN